MSTSDHEATRTAREDIGRAEEALNSADGAMRNASHHATDTAPGIVDEVLVRLDRTGKHAQSVVNTGLATARAAVTRARATYARNPRRAILVTGAVAAAILVFAALLRRS